MNTEDDEFERIEREQSMRGTPDAIHHTDPGETLEYITGWNDCRTAMLAERPEHHDPIGDAQALLIAEQAAQPYKGIADHTNQVTNGRMRIDPVTGDVGIGTPSSQPMPPEIKKMYEDYFDKCFRESSPAQQEPVYQPRQYGDVTGTKEVRTLQAQRTWVGLTDAEVEDFVSALWPVGAGAGKLLRAIEAKLKEKNT